MQSECFQENLIVVLLTVVSVKIKLAFSFNAKTSRRYKHLQCDIQCTHFYILK